MRSIPISAFELMGVDVADHVTMQQVVRVSEAGSAFYSLTASSVGSRQGEIGLVPFFLQYPRKVKKRIMDWAVTKRPGLAGHTQTPAINWFNLWETRLNLIGLGFDRAYDRWDSVDMDSYPLHKKMTLRVVKKKSCTRLICDAVVPSCSYLWVSDGGAPDGGRHVAANDLTPV